MTKLSTIPQHQFSITCGLCKHHTMLEVVNLIAVVGGDTTAQEVRQRARCHNCGVKGNNTYQIVYRGASDAAMDGTAISWGKSLCLALNSRGGGKKQPPFYSDMSCSHIFCEKGSFFFIIREGQKSYLENPVQKMYSAVKFIKSDQPALKFLTG